MFGAAAAMTVGGAAAIAFDRDVGKGVMGAGLIAFAVWLMTYDVARRTVRQSGLTRYIAACLLAGYVWLGVAGVLLFATEAVTPGVRYDAVLHAIFVGFVVSMIFGHAPIVFPAVLHHPLPYRRILYLPLFVLHASVAMRLAGDLIEELGRLRAWGGLWNAVAIALFMAITVGSLFSVHPVSRVPVAAD
jgi:hypothetical protein